MARKITLTFIDEAAESEDDKQFVEDFWTSQLRSARDEMWSNRLALDERLGCNRDTIKVKAGKLR
jgi:hypothetical protein